ncbi:MAG: serine hydroxymethyltransferase [Holosporaceae bacterium]
MCSMQKAHTAQALGEEAMRLSIQDPEIFSAIKQERRRQENHLELIASENIVSEAVLEAQGSLLTNKYAEGYPSRRYYGGCEAVDQVEACAIDRAKKLFGCGFANVQPHSGSSANCAVFLALLKPGDTFMALSLNAGGHLTHGAPVNFSGKWFQPVPYGVDPKTHLIDMDHVRDVARKHRPRLIIAGITAYPRSIDFKAFKEIADEVGAYLMVDMAHIAGLVATGLHASPFPHAHVVTSTTHKTLRGPRGGLILSDDAAIAKKINTAVFPGLQGGPLMHVIAAKAVAFQEALAPTFKTYIKDVVRNAQTLARVLCDEGLSLVTGGTDNHMLIADLRALDISGAAAEKVLEHIGLVCNKNTVPEETRSPFETSGIRLGTPACTTRGLQEDDFAHIGRWIAMALKSLAQGDEGATVASLKEKVAAMAKKYPLAYHMKY